MVHNVAISLHLNITEYFTTRFGLVNKPFSYSFNGTVVTAEENVTELGVIFNNQVSVTNHCHFIARKAYISHILYIAYVRALILRCFFFNTDRNFLLRLCLVFVSLLLDYNPSVWSPHTSTDISILESVQKYFIQRLFGMESLT